MIGAWKWLKKYWKWILFPIGILSAFLAWLASRRGPHPGPLYGTTDEAADEALDAQKRAAQEYKERVEEINKQAEERLQKASEDQIKEYEELKDKSPEEVAKWIDSLS